MINFQRFLGGVLSLDGGDVSNIELRSFVRRALFFGLKGVIFRLFARNDLILLIFVEFDDRDGRGLKARRSDSAGTFISLQYEFRLSLHI